MKEQERIGKVQELVYELRVSDAARRKVISAGPDTPMSALRQIMRENRISGVPIVQEARLVGIISIEDFIKWLAAGAVDCPVKDKMTQNVQTLYADEPLVHAVGRLEQTGLGRFPVVDRSDHRLVGILTKGDIIESLLRKLEVEYQEEEIHRYRASHIFEDIIADKTTLVFQSHVKAGDFEHAGRVSSELKKTLTRLGIRPAIVRRAAIAAYEAEMNLVIHTREIGEMRVEVDPCKIRMDVTDTGPGIPDVEQAMQPGFSTASERVRELGFGAGMGLCNIKKCADTMDLKSAVGQGTHLELTIQIAADPRTGNGAET